MNRIDKVSSRKRKAVNVSIDADLVDTAKSLDMNLSQIFESGLRQAVADERKRRWIEENREAIAEHNARVEREGSMGFEIWKRHGGSV